MAKRERIYLRVSNGALVPADACNDIVWRDDKQACDVVVRKRYAEDLERRQRELLGERVDD